MDISCEYLGLEREKAGGKNWIRGASKEVIVGLVSCLATRTTFKGVIRNRGLSTPLDAKWKYLMYKLKLLNTSRRTEATEMFTESVKVNLVPCAIAPSLCFLYHGTLMIAIDMKTNTGVVVPCNWRSVDK
jgi:hypothetical protein